MKTAERRKHFLNTVRTALGRSSREIRDFDSCFPDQRAAARMALVDACRHRSRADRLDLLSTLTARAAPLNLRVQTLPDRRAATAAIQTLVQATEPEWGPDKMAAAWTHPLLTSLDLESALAAIGVPLATIGVGDAHHTRKAIGQSYIGITAADHCVADTATLVMITRPGEARAVSLVPSIHVAVITLEQIVKDLEELYALLKSDLGPDGDGLGRCTTFVSGPSKTADIELTMVHGAHGPRALHLLVITG